jgi:GNAT superfamily N-acetyltransferase
LEITNANATHYQYAADIAACIDASAKVRGTGIALRTPEYIRTKMQNGNAVIAIKDNTFVGFCYIEVWGHGKYVAHSGLIVSPDFRGHGVAKKIKKKVLDLSLKKFPDAKIFGITTGMAVMKINYELGYKPVHFSELTDDPEFWNGCKTCKNFDVLTRTERTMCLCTGMLYDPKNNTKKSKFNRKVGERLKSIKNTLFIKKTK